MPYFGNTPAQVPRDNYYGFRDDFMHTLTDVVTFKAEHHFSGAVTIRLAGVYHNLLRQWADS